MVVTLADVATTELHQKAISPSQNGEKPSQSKQSNRTSSSDVTTGFNNVTNKTSQNQTGAVELDQHILKENLTEEIPSFSEWAQKQLEEAEKNNKEPSNASSHHHQHATNGKAAKLRWKNYASLDCGAKVVASNPETVSPGAVLSPSSDEYALNKCTSRVWFVIELCEAIQAKNIDVANFELFSSSPKEFSVFVSDRFPTRDWSSVGHFTAKDERNIQSFDLNPHLFAKFIKVEVKSHYGAEHYCPISLFRAYGTSEFEVLEKEDPVHVQRDDEDDDDEELAADSASSKDIFSSATDAVINIVKKAAQVLGKGNHSNQTVDVKKEVPLVRICTSPLHLVVCENCNDALFGQVYELLSCRDFEISMLLKVPLFRTVVTESVLCGRYGFVFGQTANAKSRFVECLFPHKVLGAICNMAAVFQHKVVLNGSNHYSNASQIDEDKLVNLETTKPHVLEVAETTATLNLSEGVKSICSTDVTYASQIKPTKTLTSEIDLTESSTMLPEEIKVEPEEKEVNVTEKVEESTEKTEIPEKEESESAEAIEEVLENFIDNVENVASVQSTTPQAQKESVFLRLSNRIKALERNMSLSSQYLEELSKRYKKQVEEIQKLLDKTVVKIKHEEYRSKKLEEHIAALTTTVEALLAEKNGWSSTVYYVIVSSLVTLFLVTFCCKVSDPISTRRKSLDVVSAQKKKRRPSDQVMKVVRSSIEAEHLRKKKKKKVLKRSNSFGSLGEGKGAWSRQQSAPAETLVDWLESKHLEEVPFVLDESEHSSLEPMVLEGVATPVYVKTALSARAERTNGEVKGMARKSASVDASARLMGNGAVAAEMPKEKRRGFKRIFKKVF